MTFRKAGTTIRRVTGEGTQGKSRAAALQQGTHLFHDGLSSTKQVVTRLGKDNERVTKDER